MPNISDNSGLTMNYSMVGGGAGGATTGVLGMGGTGLTAGGVGGAISGIGSAAADIFAGMAAGQSANSYEQAAQVALSNEQVVKGSLVTQIAQQQRAFDITMGAQNAQIGAAGFSNGQFVSGKGMTGSGSGAYLARSSTTQFNLNTSQIREQSYLTQQGYAQQAAADESMAKQAKAAEGGSFLGAGFSALSSVAMIALMA